MFAIVVWCIAITVAQNIPEPLDNGEGTKPSGVSISGTPRAQVRITAGMRTLLGDKRPFEFKFISPEETSRGFESDTTFFSDTALAPKKGSWGIGFNFETDVQRRLHLGIGFDGQFGTFSFFNFATGIGYNQPLKSDKIYLQIKADFLFGGMNVAIGNIPLRKIRGGSNGYIKINDTWFYDTDVEVKMSAASIVCRPELNLFFRVKAKRFLMIGGGYQIPLSSPKVQFDFSAVEDLTREERTESFEVGSPNIDFKMAGEYTDKVTIAPKGLTISLSYVIEL